MSRLDRDARSTGVCTINSTVAATRTAVGDVLSPFLGDAPRFLRPSYTRKKTSTKAPKGDRGKGENRQLKAAGTRSKTKKGFKKATECGVKPVLATTTEATAADAAAAHSGTACQSMANSPPERQTRQQEAIVVPPKPAPPSLGAVAAKPRAWACKFWRTAAGCRTGSACKFRHDETPTDCDRGDGGGGGDSLEDRHGETSAAGVRVAEPAGVCGEGERWRPGSGGASGAGAGVSGFCVNSGGGGGVGAASGEGMEEDGGVDELISGMSKLMVPRHLRVGGSARRGDPIG